MEDFYLVVNDMKVHPTVPFTIYGVFDGHGGEWCALFVRDTFEETFRKYLIEHLYQEDEECLDQTIAKAFNDTFNSID